MKVSITVNPVSGMYEAVTEIPPCTDEDCKRRRQQDARTFRLASTGNYGPMDECHGECAWVDGYGGADC